MTITPVSTRKRVVDLSKFLTAERHALDFNFKLGVIDADYPRESRAERALADRIWAETRTRYGFQSTCPDPLTPPASNSKLDKSDRAEYGLTMQHHIVKLYDGVIVNLCKSAGHCTAVCVLNNGNGAYPTVQRARDAKVDLAYRHPWTFAYLIGLNLAQAVRRHPQGIDFRPNVNQDLRWEELLPSMTGGDAFGDSCWMLGYSKHEYVLATDGWLDERYRVAFSANERCTIDDVRVQEFLGNRGSVSVVTSRRPKQPIEQWHPDFRVVDADLTDEWIWEPSVIGDLSAKGKARKLIGKSAFVHMAYQP